MSILKYSEKYVGDARPANVAAHHRDKIQLAAKLGWATKGALYISLGTLALMAAFGSGGQISGGKGVLDWVAQQSFGSILLALAGVGFICYALWRAVQVIVDPEQHSSDKEMIAKRIGWGLSGIVHAGLAVAAFQSMSGASQGDQQRMWLSSALQESWGPYLIGTLGVFVIGVGLYQFKKAVKLEFLEDVNTSEMSHREYKTIRFMGRFGLAARGVVFPIIGYYLVKAAINADPGAAKDVGGALHEIAQSGWFMLGLIAAGLAAYGVLQLFFAKYRRLSI